jgi:hypothetical protein
MRREVVMLMIVSFSSVAGTRGVKLFKLFDVEDFDASAHDGYWSRRAG